MSLDFWVSKTIVLPKKHNIRKCEEHRTLSLISQTTKKIFKIIQSRIRRKEYESFVGNYQLGFRWAKGAKTTTLALRQIVDRRLDLS